MDHYKRSIELLISPHQLCTILNALASSNPVASCDKGAAREPRQISAPWALGLELSTRGSQEWQEVFRGPFEKVQK